MNVNIWRHLPLCCTFSDGRCWFIRKNYYVHVLSIAGPSPLMMEGENFFLGEAFNLTFITVKCSESSFSEIKAHFGLSTLVNPPLKSKDKNA